MADILARTRWAGVLEQFTRRNAGRRVALEIDRRGLETEWERVSAPFAAIAYDPDGGRIAIVLGGEPGPAGRVTRTIESPMNVGIVSRRDGRDRALYIANANSHTLLMFAD